MARMKISSSSPCMKRAVPVWLDSTAAGDWPSSSAMRKGRTSIKSSTASGGPTSRSQFVVPGRAGLSKVRAILFAPSEKAPGQDQQDDDHQQHG